jgi:hypothetical protein
MFVAAYGTGMLAPPQPRLTCTSNVTSYNILCHRPWLLLRTMRNVGSVHLNMPIIPLGMLLPTSIPLFHTPRRECDVATDESDITLCDRCQHLRIRHLFLRCNEKSSNDFRYHVRVDLKPSLSQRENCSFCHFIASCLETTPIKSSTLSLYFFDPGKCYLEQDDEKVMTLYSEPRVPERIAWSWLREQLESCSKPPEEELESLQDVLVVDVAQACVVQLPLGAKYAALSYVWGPDCADQVQASTSNMHALNHAGSLQTLTLPRTISDTITVCKELGIRYLWVDRLCIRQDDPWSNKVIQLDQMTAIYKQASLTLVAAAGDDANYRLSGVSRRGVNSQKVCKFGKLEIVDHDKDLGHALVDCKWSQCGWTQLSVFELL